MPRKISKIWRFICLLTLIIEGAYAPSVFSKELPHWAQNQHHYANILNPIAAQVMGWVELNQQKNNTMIVLTKAGLTHINNDHYQFDLTTTHTSKSVTTSKQTRFIFQSDQHLTPSLQSIDSKAIKQFNAPKLAPTPSKNTLLYYRARELAYWWLAHLDGHKKARLQGALTPWINKATFQSTRHQNTQKKRSALLPDIPNFGGHLLRQINIEPSHQAENQFKIHLLIDWQGTFKNGKTGIANLEHILIARLLDDGTLLITRITESTHLPSLEPWTKILC